MADFPIQRTTATLPGVGPNVYLNVDTRTGAGVQAQALGQLGAAATDVGITFNRLQAQQEFVEAQMADQLAMQELALEFERNPDPHAYDELFDQTMDVIQQREIKNGLARSQHDLWVKKMTPAWNRGLIGAKENRIKSNFMATLFQAEQDAIQNGRVTPYIQMLHQGAQQGIFDAEEVVRRTAAVANAAEQYAARQMAMRDPEGMLTTIKGDKIEGFVTLTPGQVQDIRQVALGTQSFNKNYRDQTRAKAYEAIFALAADPEMTPEKIHSRIQMMEGLDGIEKAQLFRAYMSVSNDIFAGKPNPFTTTRDYNSFAKMMVKIQADQPVTLGDLMVEYLADYKTKGPAWSINDYRSLVNMLNARNKPESGYSRTHPVAKALFNEHLALYAEYLEDIKANQKERYLREYFAIEEMLQRNWGDAVAIRRDYDAIVQAPKQVKSRSFLKDFYRFMWFGNPFFLPRFMYRQYKMEYEFAKRILGAGETPVEEEE